MSKPVAVTDETFEAEVIQANSPTLVDFWAEWCAPCYMIAPILEEIADEYEGKLKVTRLNVGQGRRVATQFGIMAIPTLILFQEGQPVERLVGAMPKERILERIKPHLEV